MSYSVFNQTATDTLNQPIFLGEGLNVARFDQMKYRFIDRATEHQMSLFWVPDEIDLSRDRHDYDYVLNEGQRYIFMANLRYQTLLDSIQERAPSQAFGALISLPELEGFLAAWEFFEMIHSRSYTHILRNVVDDPDAVFSNIVVDDHITRRAAALTTAYDDLIELNMLYTLYGYGEVFRPSSGETVDLTPSMLRKSIIRALVTVNVLEKVRFFVSFITTFSFPEKLNAMLGSAKIITLIARDEAVHGKLIGDAIRVIAAGREGKEWQQDFDDLKPELEAIYKESFEQECEWADHLFDEGRSIPGLTADMLKDYLKIIVNDTMKGIGLEKMFDINFAHPVPWASKYLYSGNVQVAPQEADLSSYLIGVLNPELDIEQLKTINLGN